jgi:hypothetical protein
MPYFRIVKTIVKKDGASFFRSFADNPGESGQKYKEPLPLNLAGVLCCSEAVSASDRFYF